MLYYPIIKWLGGKNREYKKFCKFFPSNLKDFDYIIEPFAGSLSTSLNIQKNFKNNNFDYIFNDLDDNLIYFYSFIKEKNLKFIKNIEMLEKQRQLFRNKINNTKEITDINDIKKFVLNIDILLKINKEILQDFILKNIKFYKISDIVSLKNNIEMVYFKSLYEYCRYIMNNKNIYSNNLEFYISCWYYVKEFAFSGSVRYNKKGKFNVPYGGKGYNKKIFTKKINEVLKNQKYFQFFGKSIFYNKNFEQFFQDFLNSLNKNNNYFIFLDPPYDTKFKNYLNGEKFEENEQIKLKNILLNIKNNYSNVYFMLIINESKLINNLYQKDFFVLDKYNKQYSVNFKNCNKREQLNHLIITNYKL